MILEPSEKWASSGVYQIFCAANGKTYTGSSVNMAARIREHLRQLKSATHHNIHLQNAFNLYGEESFIASVQSVVGVSELRIEEQRHIESIPPHLSLNILRMVNGEYRMAPESIKKASLTRRRWTDEEAETIRRRWANGEGVISLAKEYNVAPRTVNHAVFGRGIYAVEGFIPPTRAKTRICQINYTRTEIERRYRKAHPEVERQWIAANKEKVLASRKKHYELNRRGKPLPEKQAQSDRERSKRWYEQLLKTLADTGQSVSEYRKSKAGSRSGQVRFKASLETRTLDASNRGVMANG